MKKVLFLLISVFAFATANAASSGIETAQKGDFNLGLMIGIPPVGDHWDADIPMVSLDGSWVISSGFINTSKFGQNGAIDLGFYYGTCLYSFDWNNGHQKGTNGLWQNALLFRSGFHFQFLKNLDTYAGAGVGVNIWSPTQDSDWKTDSKGAFSLYTGAKYYFSDMFGVKLEFAHDFNEDNLPVLSAGIALKF
ncbi:MAG: porin family protein [Paludibacteraceae bacterium]|nr:porin family protein [Paludibacteraceae bacterium]